MITRRGILGWIGALGAAVVGRKALAANAENVVTIPVGVPTVADGKRVVDAGLGPLRSLSGPLGGPLAFATEDVGGVLVAHVPRDTPMAVRESVRGAMLDVHSRALVVEEGTRIEWRSPWNGGVHYRSASLPPRPMRPARSERYLDAVDKVQRALAERGDPPCRCDDAECPMCAVTT